MPSSSLFLGLGALVLSTSFTTASVIRHAESTQYYRQEIWSGENFLDNFDFITADANKGFVQYLDETSARAGKYAETKDSVTYLRVDSETQLVVPGPGRKSVRIESKKSFTHGLFIADLTHMPINACGLWPAFWTYGVGDDWPKNGEIDILEGSNTQSANLISLHSTQTCMINGAGQSGLLQRTDCGITPDWGNTEGCGTSDPRSVSYGGDFNAQQGGTFAWEWTSAAIKIWFWPRGTLPDAVKGDTVDVSKFGTPVAVFRGNCDIDSHFKNHKIVFNTNFCGDLAGNTYASSGCPTMPNSDPGWDSCNKYVAAFPQAYTEAYWAIRGIKIFSQIPPPVSSSSSSVATSTSSSTSSSVVASSSSSIFKTSSKSARVTTTSVPYIVSSSVPVRTSSASPTALSQSNDGYGSSSSSSTVQTPSSVYHAYTSSSVLSASVSGTSSSVYGGYGSSTVSSTASGPPSATTPLSSKYEGYASSTVSSAQSSSTETASSSYVPGAYATSTISSVETSSASALSPLSYTNNGYASSAASTTESSSSSGTPTASYTLGGYASLTVSNSAMETSSSSTSSTDGAFNYYTGSSVVENSSTALSSVTYGGSYDTTTSSEAIATTSSAMNYDGFGSSSASSATSTSSADCTESSSSAGSTSSSAQVDGYGKSSSSAAGSSSLNFYPHGYATSSAAQSASTQVAPSGYFTSTIYTTTVVTVTACPSSVKHCPAASTTTITSTIAISTTVCPVTEIPTSPVQPSSSAASPVVPSSYTVVTPLSATVTPSSPAASVQPISSAVPQKQYEYSTTVVYPIGEVETSNTVDGGVAPTGGSAATPMPSDWYVSGAGRAVGSGLGMVVALGAMVLVV